MNLTTGKIVLIIIATIIILIILGNYFNHTYIKAEFKALDPMPAKMGVYLHGYKIGRTSHLRVSKDFKKTYLFITLNQRGLHLPKNIKVEIKNYGDNERYVDIIYPPSPMIKYIRNGDTIKGVSYGTFKNISDLNQTHLDDLSEKGETLLQSATKTTDSITDLIELLTDITKENRDNIYSTTTSLKNSMQNLESTTSNLKDLSNKLNNEITTEIIRKSAKNIEYMTGNFADSSKNFITISGNFNKTSADFSTLVPKLSDLIAVAKGVLCNLNEIILGLKNTLKKRMGGARLIFGKAMSK